MLAKMAQERGLGELTNIYAIGRQHKVKRLVALFVLTLLLPRIPDFGPESDNVHRFMRRFIIC